MIDIHCHILPGIDDGASCMDESVEMARIAHAEGITSIVATPHVNYELLDTARINLLVDELNSRLAHEHIPVNILAGADVSTAIDPSLLSGYTINGSSYILIEFPHAFMPQNARETVLSFVVKGFRPIVTHPERNSSIMEKPSSVVELLESGALIQITADSLTGGFGSASQRCALRMLKKGYVHFIATDAHSPQRRPPHMARALKVAAKAIGQDRAMQLVEANPEAVISGGAIGN